MYIRMYIVVMSKAYSITEARAHLPAIVDAASVGAPIELTRRGKPVAVVLSLGQYERLTAKRPSFTEAYRAFVAEFALDEVGLDQDFAASLRDQRTGRSVVL